MRQKEIPKPFAPLRIDTARLRLRDIQCSDASWLVQLWTDRQVRTYLGGPLSPAQAEARAYEYVGKPGYFCVIQRESARIVGLCSLDKYRTGDIELSYEFLPEMWGNGYATEAIRTVLTWGFEHMHVDHIIAVTQKENGRSRRLLERLGMVMMAEFIEFNEPQVMYILNKA